MRTTLVALIAIGSLVGARLVREVAVDQRAAEVNEPPYTPSPTAAMFISLGYRELFADLIYARFRAYFGEGKADATAMGDLAETVAELDPTMRRIYELGALAMSSAPQGVTNETHRRAIAFLAKGERQFPDYYKFPQLAGQIYLVDLKTDDPVQRRDWDLKGALLLESAARKPGAPSGSALTAAYLQSKLGQQERAVNNLRELLLITSDAGARKEILEKLGALLHENADDIAAELLLARKRFERERREDRPAVPPTMYLLIGKPLPDHFDMTDLASGGRGLEETEVVERLEPLE